MAEKIQTITLQDSDEARLAPAGTGDGKYVIQRWHPTPRHQTELQGLFPSGQNDALGASIPVTLDADTTLVVKGGKNTMLTIPDNLSVDGFKPRIRFETDAITRDGDYTVAAGSTVRPRVEQISQVVSLEENGNDKNQLKDDRFPPGAWLLTVKTGARTRTYGIEQGAPGIEINAPEHHLSVTIDRTKSIEENRQNLRPLTQPEKAPARQKSGRPELSGKALLAVQKELDLSIAILGQVNRQVKPGSGKGSFNDDRLVEILAPVKKAADDLFEGVNTAINKETKDIRPLREALDAAAAKLEKLKEEGGVAGVVLDKLNKVKEHLDNVDTLRTEDKAARPPKPNGVSQQMLDKAVAAVSLPAGMNNLGIGMNPATQLSSIPNLGGTTIQKS